MKHYDIKKKESLIIDIETYENDIAEKVIKILQERIPGIKLYEPELSTSPKYRRIEIDRVVEKAKGNVILTTDLLFTYSNYYRLVHCANNFSIKEILSDHNRTVVLFIYRTGDTSKEIDAVRKEIAACKFFKGIVIEATEQNYLERTEGLIMGVDKDIY